MTTKRTNGVVDAAEWTLTLPPQGALMSDSREAYRTALSRQRALSKGEQLVDAEGKKQLLVIEYEGLKAYNATQENTRLHNQGSVSFFELAMEYDQRIQNAAGTQVAQPVQQYARYDLDSYARQNQKLIELANEKFGGILVRNVYLDNEPEVLVVERERAPRGLIERIFGGRDDTDD